MAQDASESVADTVIVDGKGQVDPGSTKEGTEDVVVLVVRMEDKSCVPDFGPLPALNPAPRARREVVDDDGDTNGVKARSLVIVPEGAS